MQEVMQFLWFAFGVAVGSAPLMVMMIILLKRKGETEAFDSENVSELIGRIRHVTSVNVDTLEKKVLELKKAVRDANTMYMKLNEIVSDARNVSISTAAKMHVVKSEEPLPSEVFFQEMKEIKKNEEKIPERTKKEENDEKEIAEVKTLSKEEKIFELRKRGWSIEKIAESLNMGVGEVSLIVEIGSYLSK